MRPLRGGGEVAGQRRVVRRAENAAGGWIWVPLELGAEVGELASELGELGLVGGRL
jgi:hypothetical protein